MKIFLFFSQTMGGGDVGKRGWGLTGPNSSGGRGLGASNRRNEP